MGFITFIRNLSAACRREEIPGFQALEGTGWRGWMEKSGVASKRFIPGLEKAVKIPVALSKPGMTRLRLPLGRG